MDKVKEMWENPRYKAIMKLGLWFLFLIIVLIISTFSSKVNNKGLIQDSKKEETVVFSSFDVMQNNLLTKDYKYTYKIANNAANSLEVYNGEVKSLVESGYYESKEEIYKYSCVESKCFKEFTDHQEEIQLESPVITKLHSVFELIKSKKLLEKVEGEEKVYSYKSSDESDLKEIKITTSLNNIENIYVVNLDETYEINFEH